jgi:hypothetical protein
MPTVDVPSAASKARAPHWVALGLALVLGAAASSPRGASSSAPPPELFATPEAVTRSQLERLPPHPRLLANAARWAALREQIKVDPTSRDFAAAILRSADALVTAKPVDYTPARQGEPLAANISGATRRIVTLAAAYRLTGDSRYAVAARDVMLPLAALAWPTRHFLDTAIGCHGLALGYDWLHDALTAAERDVIANKIRDAALLVSTTNEESRTFLWADHNWNQVCNGGLVLGALAIADREPALAHRVINRAIAMLPRAAAAYAPDGVYPEGPGYWGFGTSYHVLQLEAYRSALGASQGLETYPGFLASASTLDQLTGPTGGFFNFADSHANRSFNPTVLWFARETDRPDLTAAELARLGRGSASDRSAERSVNPLALLWLQPATGKTRAPAAGSPPLHWRGDGLQPVASLRSAWGDPSATWIALKAGTSNHSHAHMDVGSFVLEAGGVRWAVDPSHDDYGMIRSAGVPHAELFDYAQDSRRWEIFRLGPEGHNILRFGGARQIAAAHASLGSLVKTFEGTRVAIDLAATYAGQAANVVREVTLRTDRSVLIADTWTALENETDVSWQWLTRARVTPEPDGARLEQDGRTLRLRIREGQGARLEIQDVATLVKPPFDSPNAGYTRIVIRLTTAARTKGVLVVHAALSDSP